MRTIPAPQMSDGLLLSLSRLATDNDFIKLVEHLDELKQSRFRQSAAVPEETQSKWLQGRGQELDELLDHIKTCEETLKERKKIFGKDKDEINAF